MSGRIFAAVTGYCYISSFEFIQQHTTIELYKEKLRDGLLDTLELRLRKSEKHKNGKLLTVTLKALFEDSETEAKCFLLLCEYN